VSSISRRIGLEMPLSFLKEFILEIKYKSLELSILKGYKIGKKDLKSEELLRRIFS